jgi:hypothetical protein
MGLQTLLGKVLEQPPVPDYCVWFTDTCFPRPEWASWVQAVGSILAIVAAGAVVAIQHWLDLSRRAAEQRETRARTVEAFFQLSGAAHQKLRQLLAACQQREADANVYSLIASELSAIETAFIAQDMKMLDGHAEIEAVIVCLAGLRSANTFALNAASSVGWGWNSTAQALMRSIEEEMRPRIASLLDVAKRLTSRRV